MKEVLTQLHLPETTGIAVAVFNAKGQIAVVKENRAKPGLRKAGQLTLPTETVKRRERRIDTLLGTMAEVVDDAVIEDVGHEFQWPDQRPRKYDPLITSPNGTPLSGELHVVRFTGDAEYPLRPTATEEVSVFGWLEPDELLQSPDLRRVAIVPLGHLIDERIIDTVKDNSGVPLFEPGFSMQQFFDTREQQPDIEL